jgi:hypothetical protein
MGDTALRCSDGEEWWAALVRGRRREEEMPRGVLIAEKAGAGRSLRVPWRDWRPAARQAVGAAHVGKGDCWCASPVCIFITYHPDFV